MPIPTVGSGTYPATITVPAGSDPQTRSSFATPLIELANRTESLRAAITPSATKWFSLHASEFGDGAWNTANAVWSYDPTTGAMKANSAAQVWLAMPLARFLPTDAQVVEVRALVKPTSGGAGLMQMRIARHVLNYNAGTRSRTVAVGYTGSGASVELASMGCDATANIQTIGTGTLATPLVVTRSSDSRISAPQTHDVVEIINTGIGAGEYLYGLQVGVTLPAARPW